MVGCVDAEEGQAAGQHRPDGFGEREPGTVGGRGFLPAARQHGGQERQRGVGDGDEVPGEPVGGAVVRGGGEDTGVVGERGDQILLGALGEGARYGGESEVGGVASGGPGTGVRVPHPEEGVALPLDEVFVAGPGPVAGGGVEQGPASGVAPEGEDAGGGGHGPDVDGQLGGSGPDGVDRHSEDGGPRGLEPLGAHPHQRPLGSQEPRRGLADDDGTQLVRAVQPHEAPVGPVGVPVPLPAAQDVADDLYGGGGAVETDVEEPRPGEDDVGDAVDSEEVGPQHLGDPERRLSGRPGQLEGDVGGVLPAPSGPRRRDHGTRRDGHAQLPRVDGEAHRVQHGAGELYGCHGTSVWEEGGGWANRFAAVPGYGRGLGNPEVPALPFTPERTPRSRPRARAPAAARPRPRSPVRTPR
ncbi:hypothetical protein SVIOM342S_08136 [Streptomyces violaceorubidus]